jgi:hypothetical protein
MVPPLILSLILDVDFMVLPAISELQKRPIVDWRSNSMTPEVKLDLGAMVFLEELRHSWFESFINLSKLQGLVHMEVRSILISF